MRATQSRDSGRRAHSGDQHRKGDEPCRHDHGPLGNAVTPLMAEPRSVIKLVSSI